MPPPPPARGGGNKKGLLIGGLVLGALLLIGLVIALVAAGGSDDDEEAGPTTTTATATTPTTATPSVGASPDGVFAPIPGFTFRPAPSEVVSSARANFERGFRAGLPDLPGVDVDVNEVVTGVAGRTVVRRGDEVALALALVLDARWAAQITPEDALSEFGSDAPERTTVLGEQAVYYTEAGADGMAAYKAGTFLIVAGERGSRDVLRLVMEGLIANMS